MNKNKKKPAAPRISISLRRKNAAAAANLIVSEEAARRGTSERHAILSNKKYKKEKQTFKQLLQRNRDSNGYLFKKNVGRVCFIFLRALLLFGLCFLILQPLLNKISLSFMTESDLWDSTVINIPRNLTTDNYSLAAELLHYRTALIRTFLMSLAVAICQVASCTVVGYGFARFKFPFKRFWFICVMVLILVPPQTIMSSLYLHFRLFDIFGIFAATTGAPINMMANPAPYLLMSITCMGLKNGLYIYMLRQYFRGVPKELEEAAYVDGCGRFKTFYRIMLPDAKAMITSCFLFSFVWQWTDAIYTNLFLRSMRLLSTSIESIPESLNAHFLGLHGLGARPSSGLREQIIATGMLMFIAPLLVLYLVAQKGFVESLSQSGIKM
jgi:multiple sugar transport system permease protein